jgi:hypothetical protein
MFLFEQIKWGTIGLFEFLQTDSQLLEIGLQTSQLVFLETIAKNSFYKKINVSKQAVIVINSKQVTWLCEPSNRLESSFRFH